MLDATNWFISEDPKRRQRYVDEQMYNYCKQNARPSSIHKPKLSLDGNKFCFLLGENLQSGIAGFGYTVIEAQEDFDKNFHQFRMRYSKIKNKTQ
jgi:hypothetical protein